MPIAPKTRKGQSTKNKMISVAAELMHRNGVHATTVNDILSHSKTGKSQFSHYFGSKEALIIDVIKHHIYEVISCYEKVISEMNEIGDIEKLVSLFTEKQRNILSTIHAACPLGQIALETNGENDPILQELRTAFSKITLKLTDFFTRLQKEGKLKNDVDPASLSEFFSACMQGSALLAKTEQSTLPLDQSMSNAMNYLSLLKLDS